MSDWEELRRHLDLGHVKRAEAFVTGELDPRQRAGLAKKLTTYVRSASLGLPAVAVAAVGLMPSSAAAATLLSRASLRTAWRSLPVAEMVRVADHRKVTWLGDLAERMAVRLPRDPWDSSWRPVADLIGATGAPVPDADVFVLGWLNWLFEPARQRGWPTAEAERITIMAGRLLDGPFLTALVPRIFELNGLGLVLAGPEAVFAPSLVALAGAGRVDRDELLDGCLIRLHTPDRPGALRFFTGLHDLLEPTPDELAARAEEYADLAAVAPSPVAGFALKHLSTLLGAGRLDLDVLRSAAPAGLERTEKVRAREMLTLVERAIRQYPDRAGDLVPALAAAFGASDYDLAARALEVVLGHAGALGPEAREEVAGYCAGLPDDLREKARAAFGLVGRDQPEPLDEGGPTAIQPDPWPAPITTLGELELALSRPILSGWVELERVMAGLVAVAVAHPEEVQRLLDGLSSYRWPLEQDEFCRIRFTMESSWPRNSLKLSCPDQQFVATRDALLEGRATPLLQHWSQWVHMIPLLRMAEIGVGLAGPPDPARPRALLATPTDESGRLSAEVLLERLIRAEAEGWQPWPLDLEQALLRLPRVLWGAGPAGPGPDRAAGLTSPAGRRFAAFVAAGGLPDPEQTVRGRWPAREGTYRAGSGRPGGVRTVALSPGGPVRSGLQRVLFGLDPDRPWGADGYPGTNPAMPPLHVFPDFREVYSAWMLPHVAPEGAGRILADVPAWWCAVGGPAGAATTLLVAYALGAERAAERAAGVDTVLGLSAAGNLDGTALGEQLGALIADGPLVGARVYPELIEAARAGARAGIWDVLVAMLPYVLDQKPAGLPDLLALATELAPGRSDGSDIPGLSEVAGRTGTGKVVVQARRLREAIRAAASSRVPGPA